MMADFHAAQAESTGSGNLAAPCRICRATVEIWLKIRETTKINVGNARLTFLSNTCQALLRSSSDVGASSRA